MNEFLQQQHHKIEEPDGLFELCIKASNIFVPFYPDVTGLTFNNVFTIICNHIETGRYNYPLYINFQDVTYIMTFDLLEDYT